MPRTEGMGAARTPGTASDIALYRVLLRGAVKREVEVIARVGGKPYYFQHAPTASRPKPQIRKAEMVEDGVIITAPASVVRSRGIDISELTLVLANQGSGPHSDIDVKKSF